jgi:flagellar biogenesis protein FliO
MSGGAIEVLGRNHLSPKQSLTLVRVGRRVVLVGVAPERLSPLCVIDDPQEVAELVGAKEGDLSAGVSRRFEQKLGEAVNAFDAAPSELADLPDESSDRLLKAKGQLRGLMARLRSLQGQT